MDIVFNKTWFERHQRKLLWLLNTPIVRTWFRWVMRIRRYDCPIDKTINGIEPNALWYGAKYIENGKLEVTADFRTHDKYAKRLYFAFKPLWNLIHFWDMKFANKISQQLNFGFDTLTVYPEPGVTVDGIMKRDVASETWATLSSSTGTEVDYTNAISTCFRIKSDTTTDMWEIITRSIILFDTSSLDDEAEITATVLSLFGSGKTDTLSSAPTVDIYTSTPASNTTLATGDYLQTGTTSQTGSPLTYASLSTSAYNDFTFDATGRGNVSKTGISKFGVRNANYDVAGSPPTWSSGASSFFQCYFSDETGTTSDPKLVVTYSIAGAGGTNFLLMF